MFYGYANGDLLFDEGLPTTLLEIIDDVDRYSELLITGVRTDCVIDVDTHCGGVIWKSSRSTTRDALLTTGLPLTNRRALLISNLGNLNRHIIFE